MSADNVLLLFTLLWTFTAVCQADHGFSVSCDDVSGSVGEEVYLTCSVSLQKTRCCVEFFKYYEINEGSAICKKELPYYSCEQRNSFTCSYTPTTATTQPFRFFVLTLCGVKTTEFTVDINGKHGTDPAVPDEKGLGTEFFASIAGAIGFNIIMIIILIVLCVKRHKNSSASGSQNRYERGASEEQTAMTTNV